MGEIEIGDSGRYKVAVVRENGESEVSGVVVLVLESLCCLRFFDGETAASLVLFFRLRSASVVRTTGAVSRSISSTAIVVGSNWLEVELLSRFAILQLLQKKRRNSAQNYFLLRWQKYSPLASCESCGSRRRRVADSVVTASIHQRNTLHCTASMQKRGVSDLLFELCSWSESSYLLTDLRVIS